MDADARTGERENEFADSQVPGAYGGDELTDNGEQLLLHATDNKLELQNTCFVTPFGVSCTCKPSLREGPVQTRLHPDTACR